MPVRNGCDPVASGGGQSTQPGAMPAADVAAALPEPVLAPAAPDVAPDEAVAAAPPPPTAVPVQDDVHDVTAAVIGVVPVAAVVVVPVALGGAVATPGRLAALPPEEAVPLVPVALPTSPVVEIALCPRTGVTSKMSAANAKPKRTIAVTGSGHHRR